MARIWGYTWSGEETCPICLPLHEVVEDETGRFIHPETGQAYDGPPAHVRCNCFTTLRDQRQRAASWPLKVEYPEALLGPALAAYQMPSIQGARVLQ